MSNDMEKYGIDTSRKFFESPESRQLAGHLVELYMDTKRSKEGRFQELSLGAIPSFRLRPHRGDR